MGTKNNPGNYDCYAKAEPDEPIFVLLARDASAPGLVRNWARRHIRQGGDPLKAREAFICADEMGRWFANQPVPYSVAAKCLYHCKDCGHISDLSTAPETNCRNCGSDKVYPVMTSPDTSQNP